MTNIIIVKLLILTVQKLSSWIGIDIWPIRQMDVGQTDCSSGNPELTKRVVEDHLHAEPTAIKKKTINCYCN